MYIHMFIHVTYHILWRAAMLYLEFSSPTPQTNCHPLGSDIASVENHWCKQSLSDYPGPFLLNAGELMAP